MKKAKGEDDGSNTMDRISDLPQSILQRVLYYLSQKDAVRTSILSKSWRYIWCTRPNLQFSDIICFKGNKQYFLSVVNNSLQRYPDQGLCLEEFHLCISLSGKEYSDRESILLLEKWIPLLTVMGVKEFCLSIISDDSQVIVDLPSVAFEAESPKFLCLRNCNLGQKIPENIPFVRLQELRLYNVLIKQEIFDKIILSCPLLTTMSLQQCKGLKTIKLEKKLHNYLKHFTFINRGARSNEVCSIETDLPTLETIEIYGSEICFHRHKFSYLHSLSLGSVEISSNSVELPQQLCIDAPNIEYFEYTGFVIPSISFTPTPRRSKLELYIGWGDVYDALSWFLRLSNLLQALRHSEIHLNIVHFSRRNNLHIEEDILVQDIINGGNRPVVVEHLEFGIGNLSSLPSVLNALFCICRPRIITSSCFLAHRVKERELSEFICKIQMMRENGNQEIWQDLEDLTIEGFDESRRQWQPLHETKFSESALLPDFDSFRVRLQWSDQDCESSCKLSKS